MRKLMKPIIFLHGAIGAEDQLQPLCAYFSQHGYATHSFSFSGHGKMPFKNQFGIEQFSTELLEFIQQHKLEQPHVFGYSMGGYVALYLAAQHPQLFGTVITFGTKFNWTKEIAAKEMKMLDPEVIKEKIPKFAATLEQRHGAEWKHLLHRTSEMMIELGDNNLLAESAFKKITTPVMIGLGDKDNMVTVEETVAAYRQLSNASLFVLPNTKHPIEALDPLIIYNMISAP
jgi:pimeloyl-ACP methyl ester carboxylesterase